MIGNGVVIDPWALLDEIEEIREKVSRLILIIYFRVEQT